MAIITLLSDFGLSDHYVASLKAKLLGVASSATLVDISHQVPLSDIAQAAHLLSACFRDFPPRTVHLVGLQRSRQGQARGLAARVEGQYVVAPDVGLLSLISQQPPEVCVSLPEAKGTFFALEVLAPAAAQLAMGKNPLELGPHLPEPERLISPKARASKEKILGSVTFVTGYGNLVCNVDQAEFAKLSAGRSFTVQVGRERISQLAPHFGVGEGGDCLALFNSQGLLEIYIKNGRADQLLGMEVGSPVNIFFD